MFNVNRQVGKNIFSGWLSLAVRLILVFLVNPFVIHTLGSEQYGVWVLVTSIINYLSVLDLGLKQALIRFISKYLGLNDFEKLNSILNSAFIIYSGVGLIVIIISVILSYFTLDFLNVPSEYVSQGRLALLIIGLNTALNFVLFWRGNTLEAFHRFDISNLLNIFENVFRTAAIVFLLKGGYGLVPFASTFLFFNVLRLVVASGILKRLQPGLRFSFQSINRESFQSLLRYGSLTFLISVAWLLIANTDNIIIGYFLNTSSVTIFAVAGGFIIYLRSLIQAVSFPLRPVISHYEAINKSEHITTIYLSGTKFLYLISFTVAGGTMIFADSFISLWLGDQFSQSATILKILIIPAALFLPQSIANSVMFGLERHKYLLYIIVAEGVANFLLSLMLIHKYGIVGVAYGTIIPQVIIYLLVVPFVMRALLKIKLTAFYFNLIKLSFFSLGVSAGLSYLLKSLLTPDRWIYLGTDVLLTASFTMIAGTYLFGKDDLTRFIAAYKKGNETAA